MDETREGKKLGGGELGREGGCLIVGTTVSEEGWCSSQLTIVMREEQQAVKKMVKVGYLVEGCGSHAAA
ncbi:hypothetical protein AMTR_s00004p00270440 [Amborella trichopoda]|uniref:Uncharacterized protein n=1 Tax=Amborella trichopoda TaxID=13333 RepID=W1NEH9_AMBTC|nr:hypothetical protein AMTR_s00004p00270440 [Amborella trichopoda]